MIKDSHGYLWLATPNGVVRYNGYDCKIFNISNGLPTNDVWSLTEDKHGRIWLGAITREVGFIANGAYHGVDGIKGMDSYYPHVMRALGNGVIFENRNAREFCIDYIISDGSKLKRLYPRVGFYSDTNTLLSVFGVPFFHNDYLFYVGNFVDDTVKMKVRFEIDKILHQVITAGNHLLFMDNFLFEYKRNADYFWALNTRTGHLDTINTAGWLPGPDSVCIMTLRPQDNDDHYINVIAKHNILQFREDSPLKFIGSYSIKALSYDSNINGGYVSSFIDDSLWGNCLGSTINGLFINIKSNSALIPKCDIDLLHYTFVGSLSEHISYWWNKSEGILARVDNNRKVVKVKLSDLIDINRIVYYNEDTSLVFAANHNYWLSLKTGNLSDAWERLSKEVDLDKRLDKEILSATVTGDAKIYFASKKGFNVVIGSEGKREIKVLDVDRYNALVYDSVRKNFLAYNHDKIYVHSESESAYIISTEALAKLGIRQLDKIIIDNTYGNVFFKSDDKLILYDFEKQKARQILTNYNFTGASMSVYNNALVVAGKFGVLFTKITGKQKVSKPLLYPNIKNYYYTYVSDIKLGNKEVLLNTDRATYNISIPADSILLSPQTINSRFNYKLIVNYRDTTLNINTGDTIFISHDEYLLTFDFINPLGNGKARYKYQLLPGDSSWHELKGDILNVAGLPAGNFKTLSVIAYDEAFKSDIISMHLYLKPFWWQTLLGKTLIVFSLIVLLAFFAWLIKKSVLRNQQKRNMRMEMELKSIHAQLNPHFIFNSLTSALHLVRENRMKEADEHISKFSKLLRAYLRSSRNKLITIHDEIINLKNYIELQQERFDSKFDYQVQLDEQIDSMQEYIPSLLLQPFVENAINHGLLHSEKKGRLSIAFVKGKSENSIICTVADNGIGRRRSKEIGANAAKDTSYGNDLIKDLVQIFNKYEKMQIAVRYTDIEEVETGTIVEITINKQ